MIRRVYHSCVANWITTQVCYQQKAAARLYVLTDTAHAELVILCCASSDREHVHLQGQSCMRLTPRETPSTFLRIAPPITWISLTVPQYDAVNFSFLHRLKVLHLADACAIGWLPSRRRPCMHMIVSSTAVVCDTICVALQEAAFGVH